ncbi:Gfo/Idh/MocA family oxidoreductase [Mesorhizobium sp. BR1-1-16]|uniref:Gfo/Idh/MocA family protein n=1 Tax=Mesorhizobium sp. BR1-1-16 TaxID=2876653 RepID=UPI001CCECB0D|nr:Gfo/Idh/MocA family oxidoreductase [Mesorhizobium sp. BR1-1-16]MBZ9935516.1 Gfo/Idh/MocA family oxidoreductase [Mesorhizobium sp. BR1-1-16]
MAKILILGTGSMAVSHATAFAAAPDTELVAAVETDPARREAFGKQFGITELFADLESAIAWGGFDAVANVTPDAVHYPTTMRLLAAGKHVFCEKPLATSYPLALEMADTAEAKGVINMVNFTYRNSPALQKARELVMAGAIGDIRYFEASYLQSWLVSKAWGDWRTESRWLWRLSAQHGSKGVLGDVGVHIVDFASFAANSEVANIDSRLKTFHKAEGDKIGDYPLDVNDSAVMTAEFANGALGTISATRFATGHANDLTLRLFGTAGGLDVRTDGKVSSLKICEGPDIDSSSWKPVECPPVPTTYARFAKACNTGINDEPTFRRAAEVQRILDLCFAQEAARALHAAAPVVTE